MRPLYIFDLDGTLALIEHRRHFVEGAVKDWDAFFAACKDDKPNLPILSTFRQLQRSGAHCWVWTGRSRVVASQTMAWLYSHGIFCDGLINMRAEDDRRPDNELKADWLGCMSAPDRMRLVAVFEDRTRVVEMWRANGVAAFQVAKGDF